MLKVVKKKRNTHLTLQHVMVSIISDGEDVRGHLIPSFSLVAVYDLLGVDRQSLVRVNSHAEKPGVGLKHGEL